MTHFLGSISTSNNLLQFLPVTKKVFLLRWYAIPLSTSKFDTCSTLDLSPEKSITPLTAPLLGSIIIPTSFLN